MALSAGSVFVNIGARTAGLRNGLRRAQTSVQRTARKMERAGRAMSAAITVPLAAAGAGAVKMAADFDRSMNRIVGLVGIAREQVEAWKSDVREIASEVGRGPRELADALFFITSAGLRGETALNALRQSAKAAAAGLGETRDVADAVTSAVNAYGSEVLSAAQSTDVLTKTVEQGKLEASELAGSIGRVIPIAAQMGVQFQDVGAAIATMTRTGTPASTAARQLRQVLVKMMKPTDDAKEAFQETGRSFEQVRQTIREDGLLAGLQLLQAAVQESGIQMTKLVPRARALTGVLQIVGENSQTAVDVFGEMQRSSGKTQEAFQATEDASRRLSRAWVALKNAGVELGENIATAITPLLRKVTDLFNSFSSLSEKMQATILAASALVAALGPVLFIVGKLTRAVLGLGVALTSISWPVAAAAAFAGAAGVVWNKWSEIAGFFKSFWLDIKTVFTSGTELLGLLWEQMTLDMQAAFATVAKKVIRLFSNVASFASSMGVSIADPFALAFGMMEQESRSWGKTAREEVQKVNDEVSIASQMLQSALAGAFVKSQSAPGVFALATMDTINDLFGWAQQKFSNFRSQFMGGGGGAGGVGGARPAGPELVGIGQEMTGLGRAARKAREGFSVVEGTVNRLKRKTGQLWQTYSSGGQVAKAVNTVLAGSLRSLGTQMASVITQADSIGAAFQNMGRTILKALQGVIAKMATMAALAGVITAVTGGTAGFLGGASGFGGIFKSLVGFQHGGLVTGPTIAAVGEGPGTSASNPEVVAPLDKLKRMIGGTGAGGTLTADINLEELIFRFQQRQSLQGR